MFRKFYQICKGQYQNTDRRTMALYVTLRGLVILTLVRELFTGSYFNCLLCLLSLLLFTVPYFVERQLRIDLPNMLESIIYMFIFSAEILGEISNFYTIFPYWDTMLHTINGFCCAAIGYSLVDVLNRNSKNISLSPLYMSIIAFCFSMTIGVLWEFFEFTGDRLFHMDMQKDTMVAEISSVDLNPDHLNKPVVVEGIEATELYLSDGGTFVIEGGYLDIGIIDTMQDLFVNLIGAVVFSCFGYVYVRRRDHKEKTFASNFIPVKVDHPDEINREHNGADHEKKNQA